MHYCNTCFIGIQIDGITNVRWAVSVKYYSLFHYSRHPVLRFVIHNDLSLLFHYSDTVKDPLRKLSFRPKGEIFNHHNVGYFSDFSHAFEMTSLVLLAFFELAIFTLLPSAVRPLSLFFPSIPLFHYSNSTRF